MDPTPAPGPSRQNASVVTDRRNRVDDSSSQGHDVVVPPEIQPRRVGVIYGLSCTCHQDDGIQYVGQTRRPNPLTRFREHIRAAESGKKLWQSVYEWMAEHQIESIRFEVIQDSVPVDQLDYHERFHIVGLRGAGNKLMNQDDFWSMDESGTWQHTWPTYFPFDSIDTVSNHFLVVELERGIYPLSKGEFRALYPHTERQSVIGLAELLTPEWKTIIAGWREGRPSLAEMLEIEERPGHDAYLEAREWAARIREENEFPPPKKYYSPWATY